ncbi:MAG TPA: hypothetical protein DDY31_14080 [Lachnospiraceae bacterium]|nr:hypothetical protein [Lachnospiraceae bacterium]HBI62318.1 hypothetical protein [Lachnospiraceae bacterium]
MRQAQKQEILEALQSLGQAHEEIKEQLRQGNRHLTQRMPNIQNMLSECQEFAISLGECIERLEGEGHPTVGYIESYCEALYGIYAEIDGMDSERVEANKICKILRKQLIRIENSAKKDIAVRKEVVFLPYKASMWDCMESVWMAARDDEHCDAYVIPIPYYEKKWDESFGQMHYEGNEYPDYVPITGWQEYKIEERRPDIIYIQNPYDDWNTITSVPPQYYTKELKRHTDMLVYLPYFVGINDNVDEYFCIVPGVMNADRVIVQSEKVKNAYIENIQKFEKEHNCVGRYGDLDKKILPLGSPKLDRIRRVMESGKIEIPEEWKDKIYKSNGEKKKIVLYNTTIEAMLKHKEAYIDKIKSVLALFRQEEEFVLLWRPHPLLEITIKTMRPRLYWEYMLIVEEYQEEDWGIFDESADLDRAIVLSDAYYGDWSSVVELYKITKKPIMIQDCEALTS